MFQSLVTINVSLPSSMVKLSFFQGKLKKYLCIFVIIQKIEPEGFLFEPLNSVMLAGSSCVVLKESQENKWNCEEIMNQISWNLFVMLLRSAKY